MTDGHCKSPTICRNSSKMQQKIIKVKIDNHTMYTCSFTLLAWYIHFIRLAMVKETVLENVI